MRRRFVLVFVVAAAACGTPSDTAPSPGSEVSPTAPAPSTTQVVTAAPTSNGSEPADSTGAVQPCADVIDAGGEETSEGVWRISATVRSGDTGWDKYADAWRVVADGVVLGERLLTHPHENEQPFTRSLDGVAIPSGVSEVEIVARDSVNGFCGEPFTLPLSG